jgi:hypothetical protein
VKIIGRQEIVEDLKAALEQFRKRNGFDRERRCEKVVDHQNAWLDT